MLTFARQKACELLIILDDSIVAVHGLDEDATGAWTDPATQILWLRDLLPKNLRCARVLAFEYNANTTSLYGGRSGERIQQHAQTLIAEIQADRSLEGCPNRPLIFICHGLGGIVVKKALTHSSTRTSKNVEHLYSVFVSTYAILFFGTPHHGLEKIKGLQPNRRMGLSHQQEDSQLLSAIEKYSETLQAITDHFSTIMKQFHIFFFWEEKESRFDSHKGYVVEEWSAAPIIDNTERAGIDGDHAQMIRFSNKSTSSYRIVIEALARYAHAAPSIISRRWQQASALLAQARSDEACELVNTAFDIHDDNRPFLYQRKISEVARNKHFYIPQVVGSIFIGREDVSKEAEKSLLACKGIEPTNQQRRYVIHGVGGSGKTQFCSKFAQDHRQR